MRSLAGTTITVSSSQLMAIGAGFVVVAVLQLWAVAETAARRRWGWFAAAWLLFPIGMVAWFAYGRRRAPFAGLTS